jgi:2-methylcitrate dehydratase PrpD
MTSYVQTLAEFIIELNHSMLPNQAVKAAKQCILDTMGNMFCKCRGFEDKKITAFIKLYNDKSAKSIYAPNGKTYSPETAAFISTVMARSSDLDDGHRSAMGHPGSFLVPAVMAYGQALHKTGHELITALIAGYETYIRVGETINPSAYRERGFESTSITGSVACTAALGKLYGLDKIQMKNALGLAASYAGGIIEYQNDGSMGKILSGAWAIKNALFAIQLALCNFTGPDAVFEGKKGFAQAFSPHPQPEKVIDSLGEKFRITEIYFKAHACMRGLHCSIDAILDLRKKYSLTLENVASITVNTSPFVKRLSNPHPTTTISAQNSLEFTMSTALKNGHIANEAVLINAMQQKDILELANQIKVVIDPKIEAYVNAHPSQWGSVEVVVTKKNGEICKTFVSLPRGEAENPFTWEELVAKFRRMIENTPYHSYCGALVDKISHFDQLSDPGILYHPWDTE